MSPYQHLFSTNAVLNVWRNLRHNARDQNDLLLTFHCPVDDVKRYGKEDAMGRRRKKKEEDVVVEERQLSGNANGGGEGGTMGMGRKSISFVVPWRSMQAQKRALREKDRELAEALVGLLGEVGVCGM